MNKEKFIAAIIEEINNFDSAEMIQLNNQYAQDVNYTDDEIHDNGEEFFEVFFGNNVIEAVRAACYGEYNYTDNYVKFNGYGNLVSMDMVTADDLCDSVDTIAEHVAENFADYETLFTISESDFEEDEEEEEEETENA